MTTRPTWYRRFKETQRSEETSKRVGSLAAGILSDSKSTSAQKSVAGSALTQRPSRLRERILASTKGALKKP